MNREYDITEDQEVLREWLSKTLEPWDTIKSNWKKTCALRKIDLESKKVSFANVLKMWPRYTKGLGYELIHIDFAFTYPDAVNNLIYKWPDYVNKIIELAHEDAKNNNDKNGMEKFKDNNNDDENNGIGYLALYAIFYMLPKSNGSTKQKLEKMFRKAERGTQITSEVQRISQMEAAKNSKEMNPFIIYFENENHQPYKFFVCINLLPYEFNNFITALDTLFKSYFVFNLRYPKECKIILTFFQHFFFQIFLPKDIQSNTINSLMCDIDIDRGIECESLMP